MKKTLLAIAVLGAAAMTAQAANVTLYGAVDGGVMYKHVQIKKNGKTLGDTENSFKLANGLAGSNKVGIKGEEDLGNLKVGFKLENGFNISNGAMKGGDDKRLFDREARMYVKSGFGTLSAGRFGGLASAAGSYDIFFAQADAFDGGDNAVPYAFATSSRYDNSVAYQSPVIAGLQGTLMYSFNEEGAQVNKMKNNARYLGLGLTFNHENLNLVGVIEGHLLGKHKDPANDKIALKDDKHKNGFTYNLGANYDFGVAKIYTGAQISRHIALSAVESGDFNKAKSKYDDDQVNGYAFTLGSQIPVGADLITLGAYYGQYKNAAAIDTVAKKDAKLRIYGLSGRYEHQLSKRSSLYAGLGFGQSKVTYPENSLKQNIGQVYLGLHHNF